MKLTKKQEQRMEKSIDDRWPCERGNTVACDSFGVCDTCSDNIYRYEGYALAIKDIQPLVEALKYYKTLFPTTNIAEFNYGEIATKALQDFLGESD